MKVEVTASVVYTCYLTTEEEAKVKAFAEETDIDLEVAVWELYAGGEIDLYKNSVESDFNTESVDRVYEK